ncbi:hypothetical protein D9611_014557 [Ephemerocybe angulata]|uniref:Uncharacterized protein n=1 Tax=Ephemerocybe angulata TaxID=980116 RepID=A0A8H5CAH9_9AGAR|nr:hypothetical protein D9611_014557 [Tulosesus angulatus]
MLIWKIVGNFFRPFGWERWIEYITIDLIPTRAGERARDHTGPTRPLHGPSPSPNQPEGLRILCDSSHNSFGSLAITAVQGNMIVDNGDYDRLRHIIAGEIRRSIPTAVRHSNANALVITDALGETLTLPWSLVPTYEVR